nr:hypothetical protein [Tanacetum cinerariifolium]
MVGLRKKVKTCVIHDKGAERKAKKTLVNVGNKGKEKVCEDEGMCSKGNKPVVSIYKKAMVNGKAKMVEDVGGKEEMVSKRGVRSKKMWSLNDGVVYLSTGILCSSRKAFDGSFRGVGDDEVVVGEGVVVTSSSLEMLTNNCLGGIMVSLIFFEGLEEEALVEFMVEWFEEDEDGKKNRNDDLFN